MDWQEGRDHWWHELTADQPTKADPEPMDSEDLLYLLYTVRHDGQAQGDHAHHRWLPGRDRDHAPLHLRYHAETDVYWCMADIGWVTGHSYIVYGPLANATTGIIYEGAIDFPDKDRWAQIAAKYRATILYTAPTAIRAPDEVRPRGVREATISRRCACSARSASRSTPRPGPGTGSTSAASAARWSTPGGRPRPA